MHQGASRTPTAEGSLEKTPFVHLLVYLADKRLSGTLVLGSPTLDGAYNAVYFASGAPSKLRTAERVALLGEVLVDLGFLTQAVLDAALAASADLGGLLGEHLLRTAALSRGTLLGGLREQAVRKIAHLFAIPAQTPYAFYEGVNLLESWGGPELTALDPLATVWKAVRARANEPVVDATLSRLGNTVLKLHPRSDVSRFGFSPHELSVLDLLRARPTRLTHLVESQLLPEKTARLLMYTLVITRNIDHLSSGALPVALERTAVAVPAGSSAPGSTSVAIARVKLTSRRVEVPSDAPASERALTPELTARRDEIKARASSIELDDYFAVLNVPHNASDAAIQTAYYALAKTWHPDRLPAALGSCRDQVSKVFARMSEAFETLSDGTRRQRYLEQLTKAPSSGPSEAEQVLQIVNAAGAFQRAEILFRKKDYTAAEPYVMEAYRADPQQSDYAALYAMLQLFTRSADAQVDDLFELCDKAIANNSRCERAYFCRALLNKRIGKIEAAIDDFRVAYGINPNNLDAGREVRVHDMRRSKAPEQRRPTPPPRRSTPPPSKATTHTRSSLPAARDAAAPKAGGVLSGLGKLFKR